jgi:cytochrome o ubiquinol oxidase subunit IV
MSKEPKYGTGKKNLVAYSTGIVLSIILTLIPYELVVSYSSPNEYMHSKVFIISMLVICALVQLFVQIICFLRLNIKSPEGRVNVMSFLFAILVVLVIVGFSIWIMTHLNYNMMH